MKKPQHQESFLDYGRVQTQEGLRHCFETNKSHARLLASLFEMDAKNIHKIQKVPASTFALLLYALSVLPGFKKKIVSFELLENVH